MIIPSINNKDQMHWKGMTPTSGDQNGQITHMMESGISSTLYMYHDERYKLTMQYLTKDEAIEMKKELYQAISTDNAKVELLLSKCEKAGYFNYDATTVDPVFVLTDKIELSRISGTDYWNITITLIERYEAVV